MYAQLLDFKAKGFGTILIQCRLAFPRNLYMSDEFLTAYREAVEIMADLGLSAGLYDDYNWNSGQAGGRTVDGADHLRERHLFWAFSDSGKGEISEVVAPFSASMGKDIGEWIYDGGNPRFDDWELVSATLFCEGEPGEEAKDVIDHIVLSGRPDMCEFAYHGKLARNQRLLVSASARCVTSRLPNYLLTEAGERFVATGLEPYARTLEGLIPDTLGFLFYDQPAAGFYKWRQMEGNLGNSPLYAPSLKDAVEARSGLGFGTVLLGLLTDIGPETARLRRCFYRVYSDHLNSGFFRPILKFCRQHGIRLTGHEILPHVGSWALNGGFTSIDPRVAPAVDFFGIDSIRDETAVDANNFESQLSPKLGDSVARANGRSRTMVELYTTALRSERRGAGQWELSPATLRAQSIRLHLLGARQVIIHALYETDGSDDSVDLFVNPRFDFAPGLNFEPWWQHYRDIADETARLSVFLERIVPETPVAVVYSADTAFVNGPRHAHASEFGRWCASLDRLGCGYMIVDENALDGAILADGRLHMSGLSFAAVALPAVALFSAEARRKLMDFEAAGGHLWASGPPAEFESLNLPGCRLTDALESSVSGLLKDVSGNPALSPASPIRQFWGRDSEGRPCCVLFNDSDDSQWLDIDDVSDFEVWDCPSGAVTRRLADPQAEIALAAHGLLCIRFPKGCRPSVRAGSPKVAAVSTRSLVLDRNWSFRRHHDTDEAPISVKAGWQTQGHPSYSGLGIYTCRFSIHDSGRAVLALPGLAVAAEVVLDGGYVGRCAHPPYELDLGAIRSGDHVLELRVTNTAANRYYANTPYAGDLWPDRSGLTEPPVLTLFDVVYEER